MANVSVDLAMLETLLEIVVDSFIRDLTEQCQV